MINRLHYISQASTNGSHLTSIEEVLQAGCKWIQLRIKEQSESFILDCAIQARLLCQQYGARLIINDYPHIALESGAHGVHLGLDDMPVSAARDLLGANFIIGGTANTFSDIRQRAEEGVNYIGLGPYRFTRTKEKLSPVLGLEGYATLMKQIKQAGILMPVIAIGGIEAEDIPGLLQAGVYGVAVSGALTNQTSLTNKINDIHNMLNINKIIPSLLNN